ncbi:MAG TPA: recombinase family protein [Candidatus Bipolaricaulis sp.]|nr:recombinase family protein [Candidatus Bipolaricaulis sp.]HRS13858.1 recombinase family protein [Candidatus Bipolaricaulis sp.]HRU21434.1 recombinase family protein [Candidatus Bipolaricaulis sp.]
MAITIISVTEALPDGASGRFVASVHAAVSRLYSDQLGERVRHAVRTKVRKGEWPAGAPTGYVNDREARVLVVDLKMAPIVRRVFKIYVHEDVSLAQLVGLAEKLGLRTRKGGVMAKAALHKLLTSPIYYGLIKYGGTVSMGSHEPIISKALFDVVQAKLEGKSYPRSVRRFPHRGLMTCGYCGCRITASLIKGRYIYYHCTQGKGRCRQDFIAQDALGGMFLPVIDGVRLQRGQIAKLLQGIRSEGARRKRDADIRRSTIKRQMTELEDLRDKAYEDKLRGAITNERWNVLEQRWLERAAADPSDGRSG